MLTVGVNGVIVESDLVSGRVLCPRCSRPLVRWGWARPRVVHGVGVLRPRRGRCRGCKSTHVLLPVSVLLRRAYSAEIVFEALVLRARGWGHRRIGQALRVPVATVRGWLRRMGSRLDEVRAFFRMVGVRVRTDRPGEPVDGRDRGVWQQMIDALFKAVGVVGEEHSFGGVAMLGVAGVAVALSHGQLLSPGWPGVVLAWVQHELALM